MSRIIFATLLAVAVWAPMSTRAASGCFADWSEAAPVVRKEGLATVSSLWRAAQSRISGDIVKTTLCQEGSSYVYRLVIRAPNGRLSNETVDARQLFAR
jgi:uncharacterized membrane protein YkoI